MLLEMQCTTKNSDAQVVIWETFKPLQSPEFLFCVHYMCDLPESKDTSLWFFEKTAAHSIKQ